ncbi:MAG: hypothetical protein L3J75_16885 [Methylococcaceae bacterium]|nr:hypothetical protein [Methylococcaceae bacterium]
MNVDHESKQYNVCFIRLKISNKKLWLLTKAQVKLKWVVISTSGTTCTDAGGRAMHNAMEAWSRVTHNTMDGV